MGRIMLRKVIEYSIVISLLLNVILFGLGIVTFIGFQNFHMRPIPTFAFYSIDLYDLLWKLWFLNTTIATLGLVLSIIVSIFDSQLARFRIYALVSFFLSFLIFFIFGRGSGFRE